MIADYKEGIRTSRSTYDIHLLTKVAFTGLEINYSVLFIRSIEALG
jgi:hypothetical protein